MAWKGNNMYQIVYTGNSDVAMGGAAVRSEWKIVLSQIRLPTVATADFVF